MRRGEDMMGRCDVRSTTEQLRSCLPRLGRTAESWGSATGTWSAKEVAATGTWFAEEVAASDWHAAQPKAHECWRARCCRYLRVLQSASRAEE
jgi:hypothetical protein